ncbi:MAG: trimethylamine methyltransferase family protein [Deltaproteobacteria bacterium]|jgi:trimethylamine--corrinoid protein Co-methyltransferase|nr:trimethylamine methyltransferase family protein [Deltaproteobacteria bacterium]
MKDLPKAFWDPVKPEVLDIIHQKTLEVLKSIGLNFHSEEAVQIFKKHGLKTDGMRVYFDEKIVEKSLTSCPADFLIHARDPEKTVHLGKKMVVATATGCLYYEDLKQGRRPAVLEDFITIQKLYQTSPIGDMAGYTTVYPSDIPTETKFLTMTLNSLKHTSKPIICPMSHKQETLGMLKMVEIGFEDADIFKKKCVVGAGITPLNPLQYGKEALDTMISYSQRGQALFLAPASMIGMSSPISIMGTVVQQNAEILGGLTLTQLINPGSPILYMPGCFTGFMRTAGCAVSGADSFLANAINFQLARVKYKLPLRGNASITEAKTVDVQAGAETMLGIIMAMLGGVSMFHISLGIMDSILCFSPEKMLIDEEIFSRCAHIMAGPSVKEEDFAFEILNDVGPGGSFLTHKSTQKNFRKLWMPTVSHWDSYQNCEAAGKDSVCERAAKLVEQRLKKADKIYISGEQEKALANIVAEAKHMP